MRTEWSEIYDFRLGFWKWRPGGRIVSHVLIGEWPFGAEGCNDDFSRLRAVPAALGL